MKLLLPFFINIVSHQQYLISIKPVADPETLQRRRLKTVHPISSDKLGRAKSIFL
jgi:hypothetical protein